MTDLPELTPEERQVYAWQMRVPGMGEDGQRKDRQGQGAGGRGDRQAGSGGRDPEVRPDGGEQRLGGVEHPERRERREQHRDVETSQLAGHRAQGTDRQTMRVSAEP